MPTSSRKFRRFRIIAIILILLIAIPAAAVWLFLSFNTWGLTFSALLSQPLPERDTIAVQYPESFLPESGSYHEVQGTNQCAGYSAAHLLRTHSRDVTGADAYAAMNYKLSTGYVLPQGIVDYLEASGFEVRLVTSDLEQLKTHVSDTGPIIVLIGSGRHWQHYVTVVGYDNDYIYLADTMKDPADDVYNRAMEEATFMSYWNNGIPLFGRSAFICAPV